VVPLKLTLYPALQLLQKVVLVQERQKGLMAWQLILHWLTEES
jgi:hypothetical protein